MGDDQATDEYTVSICVKDSGGPYSYDFTGELIAAAKAGRVCYGIEYEPLYIDTIIRRYHELTGNWAIHQSSQKSYEQLLQEKLEKINE